MSQRDLDRRAPRRTAPSLPPSCASTSARSPPAAPAPRRRRFTWRRALVVAVPVGGGRGRGRRRSSRAERATQHRDGVAAPRRSATRRRRAPGADRPELARVPKARDRRRLADPAATPLPHPSASALRRAPVAARRRTPDGVSDGDEAGARDRRVARRLPDLGAASTPATGPATANLVLKVPRSARPGGDRSRSRRSARSSASNVDDPGPPGRARRDRPHDRAAAGAARRPARRRRRPTDAVSRRSPRSPPASSSSSAQQARDDPRRAATRPSSSHLRRRRRRARRSHHGHGPLHGLGVAFRWIGIGAVYALALGAPLAAARSGSPGSRVRAIRRRREDALLSRP